MPEAGIEPAWVNCPRDFMSHSLSHSKWLCKYHIIFTPKYRRKIIYNKYRESIRDILKSLCSYKGIEILESFNARPCTFTVINSTQI